MIGARALRLTSALVTTADPAAAERFLAEVKTQRVKDEWTSRICYDMTAVDFKRALRLAEAVADPNLRAYALGVMAVPVAKTDRRAAEELIARSDDQRRTVV